MINLQVSYRLERSLLKTGGQHLSTLLYGVRTGSKAAVPVHRYFFTGAPVKFSGGPVKNTGAPVKNTGAPLILPPHR